MEAYEQVQKGPLKLKGVAELGVTKRKKKKKDKDKAKLLEAMGTSKKNEEEKRRGLDKRTPAQAAFEKMQEKRQMERILKKASKTHKQRVEVRHVLVGETGPHRGQAGPRGWEPGRGALACWQIYPTSPGSFKGRASRRPSRVDVRGGGGSLRRESMEKGDWALLTWHFPLAFPGLQQTPGHAHRAL
uniref:Protein FAM32A n=1 Tax=Bos indicus x Bos taurus TaxID=30522 RepID=A0A4W2F0Q8_BOBOX